MYSNKHYIELVEMINELDYAYYTLDEPKVTDKKYDALYDELKEIEKTHPELEVENSPTKRVGGPVLDEFIKKEHTVPLLSLDKGNSVEEMIDFVKKAEKEVTIPLTYSLEQKMDGLADVLRYENGLLVEGRTRGNGEIGEVITEQVKTIRSVPLKIPFKEVLEVQGEIFTDNERLNIFNDKLLEKFQKEKEKLENRGVIVEGDVLERLQDKYSPLNPRNGAAGSVRKLDPKETAKRPIDAFFYGIPYIQGVEFETQEEIMSFLKEQGFKTNPYFFVINSNEELIEKLEEMEEIRPKLNFEIDGMVLKVNEIEAREEIGWTAKHPKWAIAYKFEATEQETKILNVEWQVGRTGKLTPVAHIEPLYFDGVKVTKATLNNKGDILRKGVLLGGDVWVRRSNDVIPEITKSAPETTGEEIKSPSECPSCGSDINEEGAHIFCSNQVSCPAQTIGRFIHFSSRDAMNIATLNKKTIEQLYEVGLIVKLPDLFALKKEDLLGLDRFGEKKAEKLLNAIDKSKQASFQSFLYALGIRNVGKGTVQRLLKNYTSLEEIRGASEEELMSIEDIGEFVAKSIVGFFNTEAAIEEMMLFKSIGISMYQERKESASNVFDGKTFVITGSFEDRNRNDIKAYIIDNGGKVTGSVSKNTNYLVAGEKAGSKMKKAEDLGVAVISLEQLENKNI